MSVSEPTLRMEAPNAWSFHWASSRWAFNLLNPDADETPEPGKEYADARFVPLPPAGELSMPLGEVITRRSSCRSFLDLAVHPQDISTMLHHAAGILDHTLYGNLELARRPAPSPGGMYPLELYLIARNVEGMKGSVAKISFYEKWLPKMAENRDAEKSKKPMVGSTGHCNTI